MKNKKTKQIVERWKLTCENCKRVLVRRDTLKEIDDMLLGETYIKCVHCQYVDIRPFNYASYKSNKNKRSNKIKK